MGTIQSSINQGIGAVGTLAAASSILKDQETKREAEVATATEALESNKQALKFDTIEAATAIKAHEGNSDEFKEAFKGIDFEKLNELDDKGIDNLSRIVESYRSGKMTTDRVERLNKAGDAYQKGIKPEEIETVINKDGSESYRDKTNGQFISKQTKEYADQRKTELGKAYEAERELNQRLEATRQLRFNITNAKKIIETRGGKL